MNAFELVTSSEWVMRPEYLRVMAEISAREDVTPELVQARLGKPMENTRKVIIRDNVAVIPITGPIFRRANMFQEISGATSIEMLAKDLRTALDDPAISSIVLEMDSPGGEATGTAEFASMVKDARKPVHAYVDGSACSGCYWIASACRSITISPTAILGSIGAVTTITRDPKKSANSLEFVSSRSPNKRPNLDTEKGKAEVQRTIDALGDVFIATVAVNRGVSEETVVSDFGEGGLLLGQLAVAAGMADHVGTFESLVSKMNAGAYPCRTVPSPKTPKKGMKMSVDSQHGSRADNDSAPAISAEDFGRQMAEMKMKLEASEEKLRLAAEEKQDTARATMLANVESTVASLVTSGKLLPAKANDAICLMAQAALDDADMPFIATVPLGAKTPVLVPGKAGGGRQEAISAFLGSLPAHGLTKEYLTTEAIVLSNDTTGHADDEAADKALKARIAARNGNGNGKVHAGSN